MAGARSMREREREREERERKKERILFLATNLVFHFSSLFLLSLIEGIASFCSHFRCAHFPGPKHAFSFSLSLENKCKIKKKKYRSWKPSIVCLSNTGLSAG